MNQLGADLEQARRNVCTLPLNLADLAMLVCAAQCAIKRPDCSQVVKDQMASVAIKVDALCHRAWGGEIQKLIATGWPAVNQKVAV